MCSLQDRGRKTRQLDSLMTSLNDLSERGRMTWAAQEEGWTGRPEEVLDAIRRAAGTPGWDSRRELGTPLAPTVTRRKRS